ncbi:hypothetical protein Tco_0676548 [Tanacetum coccineum]
MKEKQNVENSFSGSNEQFAEIVHLKQNLFEQGQEKECLMKTVSELKNKLKLEENRNIEREIELEKKIKQLDNIIFKRVICAKLRSYVFTKSKICYDHSSKQAIGFEKPFCLKKRIVVPDSDETLELSEKSRSKMLLKEQDPLFEPGFGHTDLKNELRKLKGKSLDNKETVTHSVDPNMSKDNMEPITPKLLNRRTAHSSYIKHIPRKEALVP